MFSAFNTPPPKEKDERMIRIFLFAVLFIGAIAPAIAGDECPIGYFLLDEQIIELGDSNINLFNKPNGSYSYEGGGIVASNNIITISVNFDTQWSIYKLTGNTNERSFARSLAMMQSYSREDKPIFEANKAYVVKFFDSSTDYFDLQIANSTSNLSIKNGLPFVPTENFTALWVRFSKDHQSEGTRFFKVMIVESVNAPKYYIPYGYQVPTSSGCIPCPPNTYKDFVGNSECTSCPVGLVSPSGSASVNECGRVLHVGGKLYHMNSVKKTSPSLNVMGSDGKIWYGNLYSPEW